MYSKLIYGVSIIGLLVILVSIQNKFNQNSIKTKNSKIIEMENEKQRLFNFADQVMKEMELKKSKRIDELNNLDSLLILNKTELKKTFSVIEKNKRQSDSLKHLIKEYEQLKHILDKQIYEKTNHIEVLTKERDDYKSRYDYFCGNIEPVRIIDTVFIYDTISIITTTKRKTRERN